jgi:site-specific recombinase XerD
MATKSTPKPSPSDLSSNPQPVTAEVDTQTTVESQIRLQSAHQDFIVHLKQNHRATSTILAYGKDIEQLIDYVVANHQIQYAHRIQPQHLNGFKSHLEEQKYTPKSISRKINSIKTFFRFLSSRHHVNSDPAAPIKHPQYSTQPPRILSELEYRALRDAARADVRISAIIELLLQAGIRIGELANLELPDIKNDQITIRPYESHDQRVIPLNKSAQAALNRYLETRPPTRPKKLFITKTGRPMLVRNIRAAIDRYFKLAGLEDVKVNDLRHTWIAHQLTAGVPLVLVSKLAGHKRLSTTEKYLKYITPTLDSSKVQLKEL